MPINRPTRFNPADKGPSVAIASDELTMTALGGSSSFARSRSKVSSGKWYVEFTRPSGGAWMFGVASSTGNLSGYCGASAQSIGLYNGSIYQGGSAGWSMPGSTTGVFGLAIDADARTVRYINASGNSGDIALTLTGDIYLAGGPDGTPPGNLVLNAGQSAFTYSVPSGYTAGFEPLSEYYFEGVTLDDSGAPGSRKVRAYLRSTGALVGEVMSDPTTGEYQLFPSPNTTGYHSVKHLSNVATENSIDFDWVVPV